MGNKQNHYLVPLAPPMMILIAQLLVEWPSYLVDWVRWIFFGVVAAGVSSAGFVIIFSHAAAGYNLTVDWLLMVTIGIAAIGCDRGRLSQIDCHGCCHAFGSCVGRCHADRDRPLGNRA